ncbi:MAG: MerR family transcriptional regulator [Pseudomonadota bacterium]
MSGMPRAKEAVTYASTDPESASESTIGVDVANDVAADMTISEMAEAFDVSMRTLRYYEEKGLIAPRRVGSRRFYGGQSQSRLRLILKGKAMGMALEDVSELLSTVEEPSNDEVRAAGLRRICKRQLEELRGRRIMIDDQIAETEKAIQGLLGVQKD